MTEEQQAAWPKRSLQNSATKPSKQQMAAVRSALREIHAELLAWDPHVLIAVSSYAQKAQITERMRQLGWHYVNDPNNEAGDVSMVEFSLGPVSLAATNLSAQPGGGEVRRARLPASLFAVFGTISVLVGIVMAIATFYTDYRMKTLDKAGTIVVGEIERTYFTSGRGGRTNYVSYKFIDARGIYHNGEDAYPFQDWNSLHPGAPVTVTYLANDPQRNDLTQRVRSITSRSLKEELTVIGIPLVVAGCFFVVYWVRKRSS